MFYRCTCFLGISFIGIPLLYSPTPTQSNAAARSQFKSPLGLAVDHDGKRAFVALHAAGAVAVVDLMAGKVLREIPVGNGPHDVALAKNSLFVSCEQDDTLVRIDLGKNVVAGRWKMRQAPRGVAVLPDASRVFVACHDDPSLCVLDARTGKIEALPLPGWPERLVLHEEPFLPRRHLVLVLSQGIGEGFVNVVDRRQPRILDTIRLVDVANPRGLAVLYLHSSVHVVHQKPRTKVPATQIIQGWVFTNSVSGFFTEAGKTRQERGSMLLDEPNQGYADPSDVAIADVEYFARNVEPYAFVSSAGADSVLALSILRLVRPNSWGDKNHALGKDDLTLSRQYVKARIPTQPNPRRLAISGDEKTLVTANYLGDSLTVIDAKRFKVTQHISLGGPKPDAARRGEILFNSNRMTFHGQFTCASCHPNGGADGLNWDLSRDGIGNFMNTRSLLGVKDTAPYGWLSTSPTLADRVSGTLRTLHRHEPQGSEVDDIVAYLKTLRVPRPLPQKETDRPAITRGQAIFQGKGKCMTCHRRAGFDDDITHDVGTRVAGDAQDRFDTPSLRGLARTAPYLHHGQARTLAEIFTKYNPRRRHGAAHQLTRAELADLVAYLKSL